MVSSEKQIWHCFGCGLGGDIFKFLMRIENIEFIDALKILAKRANVELTSNKNFEKKESSRKDVLIEMLNLTSKYYNYILLNKDQGKIALNYLTNRGITIQTIEKFKLGFSLNTWDSLYNFLKSKKYKDEDIFLAGLVIRNNSGKYYDRFRNRIMYPIFDLHGETVGFGARILIDNKDEPKYINSPQSEVYDKSNILFGLNFAKDAIKKEKCSVVVEGYMDCISSHQAGISNVVASSGTALTNGQVKILKRFSDTICFSFDQDLAGQNATERGIDIALTNSVDLKIIDLKNTKFKDPDECIKSDPAIWTNAINNSVPYIEYFFSKIKKEYLEFDGNIKPKEVDKLISPFISKLSKIKSDIEKDLWLKNLSRLVGINQEALVKQLHKQEFENANLKKYQNNKENVVDSVLKDEKKDKNLELQEFLISSILNNPKLLPILPKIKIEIFGEGEIKNIVLSLLKCYNEKQENPIQYVLSNNENKDYINYLAMLGEKIFSDHLFSSNDLKRDIKNIIFKLYKNLIDIELKKIKQELSLAEAANDKEKLSILEDQLILKMNELKKIENQQK